MFTKAGMYDVIIPCALEQRMAVHKLKVERVHFNYVSRRTNEIM